MDPAAAVRGAVRRTAETLPVTAASGGAPPPIDAAGSVIGRALVPLVRRAGSDSHAGNTWTNSALHTASGIGSEKSRCQRSGRAGQTMTRFLGTAAAGGEPESP